MNIIELGAVGELVGGVAVIASLLYVAAQVRQGNSLARVQVHQEASRMSSEQAWRIDSEMVRPILQAAASLDSLSAEDRLIVRARFIAVLNYYEMLFYARRGGHVDEELWSSRVERLRANIGTFSPKLWHEWKNEFGASFRDFVDHDVIPALTNS